MEERRIAGTKTQFITNKRNTHLKLCPIVILWLGARLRVVFLLLGIPWGRTSERASVTVSVTASVTASVIASVTASVTMSVMLRSSLRSLEKERLLTV